MRPSIISAVRGGFVASVCRALLVTLVMGVAACGGGGSGGTAPAASPDTGPELATDPDLVSAPPTSMLPNSESQIFVDATAASNIAYAFNFTRSVFAPALNDATSGGAAAGDCDADGDVDLFITYGDHGPNRLYLNQLNRGSGIPLQFQDTAAAAGVANTRNDGRGNDRHSGPIFADMDGDGDLDLFIGGLLTDPNKLYRNRGDCTFDDVTIGSGIDALLADHTISAAFGDYDLDGDLDLFLTHWQSRDELPVGGESEHLFRNLSDSFGIRFENVSRVSGVTDHLIGNRAYSPQDPRIDSTFTPSFARVNDDVWPDITIAGDYETSQLLLNDSADPGTFRDATNYAVHRVQYGMGSALGDIDFDGDLDWFVTAAYMMDANGSLTQRGNYLYENPGGDFSVSQYADVTGEAGVADGGWGWGACFLDIDNDTDLDIYHTNGWESSLEGIEFISDRSRAFARDGTGSFVDRAFELGLDDAYNGRGVVCADFDNDGDIDILQLTKNKPGNSAALWQNVSAAAGNNFLRVRLIGLAPNTEAVGARIFARIGTRTQMREITIGSNYTSQNPTVQVFGLAKATSVDELRVEWPALVSVPGADPLQLADWSSANVPAGVQGETLVICHPDLSPVPAICI